MAHLSSYPHPHNLSLSLSRFPTGSLLQLHPMETAQESELQERQQAWWWPLDNMASSSGSLDMSSNGSCFLVEWDSQLRFLGLGVVGVATAAGNPDDRRRTIEHELGLFFPKCMESPASSSEAVQDATVMPEDQLDELLQSFWDAEDEKQQLIGFSSSSILKENGTFVLDDDDLLASLSSVSPVEPALPEPEQQPPSSSSSSHCNVDPPASDAGGPQPQTARTNCSSKRSATREDTDAWNVKRSRTAAAASSGAGRPTVARPFTVVKPGGFDGDATLADINERILTRPARPVRHPVGEFACVPRASASAGCCDRPAPSGKAVAGFTRLHTGAGKGTITIIRTSS